MFSWCFILFNDVYCFFGLEKRIIKPWLGKQHQTHSSYPFSRPHQILPNRVAPLGRYWIYFICISQTLGSQHWGPIPRFPKSWEAPSSSYWGIPSLWPDLRWSTTQPASWAVQWDWQMTWRPLRWWRWEPVYLRLGAAFKLGRSLEDQWIGFGKIYPLVI